jgi:hypothetical protein
MNVEEACKIVFLFFGTLTIICLLKDMIGGKK